MKYIRTKEGNIYQRFFKDKSIRGVGGGGCCDQNLNPIGETVIKESDTIEELCDEFVIDFGKTNYPTNRYKRYADFENLKKEIEDREKNFYRYLNVDFIVRGAIWTDKGLIYVAKMNEKGELELL